MVSVTVEWPTPAWPCRPLGLSCVLTSKKVISAWPQAHNVAFCICCLLLLTGSSRRSVPNWQTDDLPKAEWPCREGRGGAPWAFFFGAFAAFLPSAIELVCYNVLCICSYSLFCLLLTVSLPDACVLPCTFTSSSAAKTCTITSVYATSVLGGTTC
jgi:hypothetical protein